MLSSLNLLVGVIDGFRWRVLGRQSQRCLPSLGVAAFLLRFGIRRFGKAEANVADLI